MIKVAKKPDTQKKHGSKKTQYVFYLNCVMRNNGMQGGKNPNFDCTIKTQLKYIYILYVYIYMCMTELIEETGGLPGLIFGM